MTRTTSPSSAPNSEADEQTMSSDHGSAAGATSNTSPIRIAQVLGRLGGGGAQQLALNLAIALSEAGHESSAIALKKSALGEKPRPIGTTRVVELAIDDRKRHSLLLGAIRLRRLIRRHRLEVLHVHGSASLPFCIAATRGMLRRPKFHFTWHDSGSVLENESPKKKRMMLWALRHCEGIYGSSTAVTERLQRALDAAGISTPRARVFRNGVPATDVTGLNISREGDDTAANDSQPPTLLWMGRLVPPKDPEALIRVAGRLKGEGFRFNIVMAGSTPGHLQPFAERLQTLVNDFGLNETIEFPGWIDDPTPLLARSAIGVQTSLTEGLSMAVLEQMMAGLPVVGTDVGDTAVALDDGRTGFVIPKEDDQRLYAALRPLLADPSMRRSMGRAARERAMESFSLKAMARNAVQAYRNGPNALDDLEPTSSSGGNPTPGIATTSSPPTSTQPASVSTHEAQSATSNAKASCGVSEESIAR
ncbi:MAG: glycosyltransferase family 4 protein [Planctomycetota bacterium]